MKEERSSLSTEKLYEQYVMPTYAPWPLALERGEGSWVWDEQGRRYLDFTTGIGVCSLGHCHPQWQRVLREQGGKLVHDSNLFGYRQQGLLAAKLTENVVGSAGKVFFSNSGAEANEVFYKLARRYGALKPSESGCARYEIVSFRRSFHGRTMAGISATGQDKVKQGFNPLLPGFFTVEEQSISALEMVRSERTVAIILEPIQGEGGVHLADPQFLQELAAYCRQHDLLLFFDEVQCGLGRAGEWCAWKALCGEVDWIPDGVSWAKGIGSGYPLGATWIAQREVGAKQMLCDLLGPGSHGTTYGGSPLACALGLAVLETIEEEKLMENVALWSEEIRERFAQLDSAAVAEVRGVGLIWGIVWDGEEASRRADFDAKVHVPSVYWGAKLREQGLLTPPAGPDVTRWLPPLNVGTEEIDYAFAALKNVL